MNATNKKRRGRPSVGNEKRKGKQLHVYLTADEAAAVYTIADERETKVSRLLHDIVLDYLQGQKVNQKIFEIYQSAFSEGIRLEDATRAAIRHKKASENE